MILALFNSYSNMRVCTCISLLLFKYTIIYLYLFHIFIIYYYYKVKSMHAPFSHFWPVLYTIEHVHSRRNWKRAIFDKVTGGPAP